MAATIKRISRERKELIAQYATAAINLYGVISVDEFVEVFNHYEEAHTTSEEAILALTRLARTDDVDYSIFGDLIWGLLSVPDDDDFEDNVKVIRKYQKGKPRYLPSKEEFLKYVDFIYREPEAPYAELKAFILNHKLTSRGEGLEGVDGDLIDLHSMIQFGVSVKYEFEYFSLPEYTYKNEDELRAFFQLVVKAHNHTRMYDNNGFTPNELAELQKPQRAKPNLKEPIKSKAIPKANWDAPCPCGSGLLYKNCHGRKSLV